MYYIHELLSVGRWQKISIQKVGFGKNIMFRLEAENGHLDIVTSFIFSL